MSETKKLSIRQIYVQVGSRNIYGQFIDWLLYSFDSFLYGNNTIFLISKWLESIYILILAYIILSEITF